MAATVVVKTANGTAISVNGIIIDPSNASPGNALVFSGGQFVPGAGGGGGVTQAYQTVQSNLTSRTQRNIINFQTRFTAVDNAGNFSTDVDLAVTGVSAGTYTSVTVDTYGRVTGGTSPPGSTTLGNAYANGAAGGGLIGLTSSGGGLIVRDNATPIAATLLGAQNNAGTTTFFSVTTAGAFATAYDATLAAGLTIGGTNATAITLGKAGVTTSAASVVPLTTNVGTVGSGSLLFSQVWATNHVGAMVSGSFSATPIYNVANGEIQTMTLTGNVTSFTVTNVAGPGQILTLIFVQDATGGRTLSGVPSNVKFAGGAFTLSTAANARDTVTLRWDSTASVWQEIGRGLFTAVGGGGGTLQAAYTAGGAGGGAVTLTASGGALALTYQTVNATQTAGLSLINSIAATAGQQQYSPMLEFLGTGYNAGSQVAKMAWQLRTITGAPVTNDLVLWNSINGSAYAEIFKMSYDNSAVVAFKTTTNYFTMHNTLDTGFNASGATLYFLASGSVIFQADSSGFYPQTANAYACGLSANYWTQVNSKHYVSQGTAPSIAVGTAAQLGTSPSATLTGTDTAGVITITTGTTASTPTLGTVYVLATITFNTAFSAAPQSIMINPANDNSSKIYALGSVAFSNNDTTTTTWKLSWGSNTGFANSTVYKFQYNVMG